MLKKIIKKTTHIYMTNLKGILTLPMVFLWRDVLFLLGHFSVFAEASYGACAPSI